MRAVYFFSVFLLLFSPCISFGQVKWTPVTNKVSFKIKNAGINVSGTFDSVTTTLSFSPNNLAGSSLVGIVRVNSIHTGINKRDKDLKQKEYFNTNDFKEIEIKSLKIYFKDAQYAGLFDIIIKGVTRQVEIPFEFDQFGSEATLKGSFTINRRDYGVGGSSFMMADMVTVNIEIKAKK